MTTYTEEQYNEAKAWLEENPVGTEPSNEQLLADYVDEFDDETLYQQVLQMTAITNPEPKFDRILSKDLESIVLIDGIPKTDRTKIARLEEVIDKKIEAKSEGEGKNKFDIKAKFYPFYDDKDLSEGYCLYQFSDERSAGIFCSMFNNYKQTKKNTWTTWQLSAIEKYRTVPDEWIPPDMPEKEFPTDLELWENDENDQFFVLQNGFCDIYSNQCGLGINKTMAPTGPLLLKSNPKFVQDWPSVRWSPYGTYLLVFDPNGRGVGLFGGSDFRRLEKFPCQGAFNAEFSPNEEYILFQSGVTDEHGCFIEEDIKPEVSVWSVLDNEKKKTFLFSAGLYCASAWERFQWSYDGRFLGTTKTDHLCIFDVYNDFKPIVDTKGKTGQFINVPGLKTYMFSPGDNYVAYWTPEDGERPLRVVIQELPSMNIIRTKNLYNVKDLEMMWHPQGTYFAIRCAKTIKGRKTALYSSFELFHIKEREVPVDIVECRDYIQLIDPLQPDKVIDPQPPGGFAWEPNGNRFAVYYGPNDVTSKTMIKVFKPSIGEKIRELPALERHTSYNSIHWCPTGRYLCLAQFKRPSSSGGPLEFLDVDGETFTGNQYIKAKSKELSKPVTLATNTHQFVTDLEWDSTGRYCVTFSSRFQHKMENGYMVWNFQGKELYAKKMDQFCLFKWRPRPKSILTKQQVKQIQSNIKDYAKKFQETDALRHTQVSAVEQKKLFDMLSEWNMRKNRYDDLRIAQEEHMREIDHGVDGDAGGLEEVEVNTLIKSNTNVVSRGTQ